MRRVTSLDTTALTGPIDRDLLAAFRRSLPVDIRGSLWAIWWPMVALNVSSLFLTGFFAWLALSDGPPRTDNLVVAGGLAAVALFVLVITTVSAVSGTRRRRGVRQFRLSRFARDNDWTYAPVSAGLAFPGMIFGERAAQVAYDVVRGSGASGLVIGNQTFTTGEGKNRRTHRWGFASVRLGTSLPHIVLDARSNNALGATNLPVSLDPTQRLELEGDFSRHFTLYAPHGYERDALYLFTPDVMARFVDHAAAVDIEIIDDRIFLYSRRDLATLDPAVWEWLVSALDAVTEKIEQWRRWRDDRLGETQVVAAASGVGEIVRPPRGVAPEGRRLVQRVHWAWIAIGGAFAAWGLFTLLRDVWSGLFG
ncbi:hypothetical protein [Microbacterium sp.]|uniref:hypothetical protein n=1 Tax=Microbacterium sp. TaxID=51671 RepID=UPI0039E27057